MIVAQQLRNEARLSVAALAAATGVARASITRLEQTGEPGHFDVLRKLATHFGVEPADLLVEVGPITKEAA